MLWNLKFAVQRQQRTTKTNVKNRAENEIKENGLVKRMHVIHEIARGDEVSGNMTLFSEKRLKLD